MPLNSKKGFRSLALGQVACQFHDKDLLGEPSLVGEFLHCLGVWGLVMLFACSNCLTVERPGM